MKKTFKRIITLALALTLAIGTLALTSCGAAQTVKIGVPDDATNLARAIKLLEVAGLIEVDPAAGYSPELKDITNYIYNIEIIPSKANTLTATLDDFGASTINGTYATSAGLTPSKDAILIEDQSTEGAKPYVNILVARTDDKDNPLYATILDAFQTDTVAVYMLEKYGEAYVPAFEYDATGIDAKALVEEVDSYVSSKEGKTVVILGVCGAKNDHWRAAQKVLDEQNAGIYLELQVFDEYTIPNEALNTGEIDLNSFQHKAYLQKEIDVNGYNLSIIGDTLTAPLSLYSNKVDSVDALKELAGLK